MSTHGLFLGLFTALVVLGLLFVYLHRFYTKSSLFRGRGTLFFSLACAGMAALLWVALVLGEKLYHFSDSCFLTRVLGRKQLSYDLTQLASKNGLVPVLVIGSGPAGLSAALYAARARLFTVVLAGPLPGGQLTGTSYVENWPGTGKQLGATLVEGLRKQAEGFGAQVVHQSVARIDCSSWPFTITTQEGSVFYALSLIVASGAQPKRLGVAGEAEYWGKGVTTCATCDAPFYKNKQVVVVGGGDSAIEESIQLASYARSVTLLVRKKTMRAAATMQEKLAGYPTITVRYSSELASITGDGKHVTGVTVRNNETGVVEPVAFDGVFLAIGHTPNTEAIKTCVACDEDGYIVLSDRSQETTVRGIFAAGDVADRVYKQAGVASGDGIKAALDAEAFLRSIGWTNQVGAQFAASYFEPALLRVTKIPEIADRKQFDQLVKTSAVPVVVQFSGDGCPACVAMAPLFQRAAAHFGERAAFIKADFTLKGARTEFSIEHIPLFLVLRDGKVVARAEGSMGYQELLKLIGSQLAAQQIPAQA